jgi:hypothetical protein
MILFALSAIGMMAALSAIVAYNSNYSLKLISDLCRVRLAEREAGAAARAQAWKDLGEQKQVAA